MKSKKIVKITEAAEKVAPIKNRGVTDILNICKHHDFYILVLAN